MFEIVWNRGLEFTEEILSSKYPSQQSIFNATSEGCECWDFSMFTQVGSSHLICICVCYGTRIKCCFGLQCRRLCGHSTTHICFSKTCSPSYFGTFIEPDKRSKGVFFYSDLVWLDRPLYWSSRMCMGRITAYTVGMPLATEAKVIKVLKSSIWNTGYGAPYSFKIPSVTLSMSNIG